MSAILASLRHPLIQAPMAFAHDTALPLAVCRAGALGSLAAAMYGPPALEQALQTMRDEGGGLPYNLNFFAHRTPEADEAQRNAWLAVLRPYFDELGLSEGGRLMRTHWLCWNASARRWPVSISACPHRICSRA